MRECLGWITNCANDQSCPQNWLELAVSELPTAVACHVCERRVDLVLSENDLQPRGEPLAAAPVVPCTGIPGVMPKAMAFSMPSNGAGGHSRPAPMTSPDEQRPLTPLPAPASSASWVVTLQNAEMIRIDKDTMIIGRSRTCDVVIPSAKVSRQHASITRIDGELYIEDLGSANGVWLNGEKVTRARINQGDTFTISDETLLFEQR